MKKYILLLVLGLCLLFTGCSEQVTIHDSQGNTLAVVDSGRNYETGAGAYCDIVIDEAIRLLAQENGCSPQEAEKALFSEPYIITTFYNSAAYDALEAAAGTMTESSVGCALTDLEGRLLAVYSSDPEFDYATNQTAPYSALKPLSVYAQAIEAGVADWSTTYEDSPYKQLIQDDGATANWPANDSGTYEYAPVYLYQAIRESLNTAAVKCLAEVGVEESIRFLQEKLGMPLDPELYALGVYGADEVIGNIALGYLETGVSPVDMAGYYQIFANGGVYTVPRAVSQIQDPEGNVICTAGSETTRVVSAETAQLMQKLLQQVTDRGGTGAAAVWGDIPVAGKTGTGDNFAGNWFVGVTPGYSCAVWHSTAEKNHAPELFSRAMQILYGQSAGSAEEFFPYAQLKELVFCKDSGKLFGAGCATIEVGYYAEGKEPETCDLH